MTTENNKISRVVIAGGGTAGWIAAAALSKKLGNLLDITLVESEEIGTVGVGEASIPPLRNFHKLLNIDEREFMQATQATAKLGIVFNSWGQKGDRYIHSFGRTGTSAWMCDFHHFWLHGREMGFDSDIGDFCLELQAAEAGKFATSPQSEINFAYHLDAGKYAKLLRAFAERNGATRVEGKIRDVRQKAESGCIESLILEDGREIPGDLFIDCTGFRGLLIEQALKAGYEDWSHWLPCDRAVPVQTEAVDPAQPYTHSIARDAGWQWRIPLQSRVGNGMVYCSKYLSDGDAVELIRGNVEGEMRTEPRVIRFQTGRRRQVWNQNCVALGLASGFVEPLESTSIHLIITGVTRLMQLFPFDGISPALVEEYNQQTREEVEHVRDFIVLHYHLTQREDTEFWRYCKNMQIPDSLAHRIQLFRERAHAYQDGGELFRVDSWAQVMLGQGIRPKGYHPLPRLMTKEEMNQFQNGLKTSIAKKLSRMPRHQDFIDRYCKSDESEASFR